MLVVVRHFAYSKYPNDYISYKNFMLFYDLILFTKKYLSYRRTTRTCTRTSYYCMVLGQEPFLSLRLSM